MAAKSHVNITIGASLGADYKQAFSAADKRMDELRRSADGLSSRIGDIRGFRQQQNAVKQAGREWQAAKAKAEALRLEITKSGTATKGQEAALRRADAAARRAGGAYSEARSKLSDMSRQLERSGTNVGRLSREYRRLQGELSRTHGKQTELERSLARQQRLVNGMATAWRGMRTSAGVVGGAVAGMAAGAAVLARPVGKALTYDEQLTYMADTAADGGSIEQRRAMKKQLEAAVNSALKAGGGKREDAASALNTMIASGEFSASEASAALVDVNRTAFASGASADDVANTAIAMKRFGIRDLGAGFDAIMKGGQLGGFELRDMAKSLPSQLALARASGYSGQDGLSEIVAANQVAMRTAGNADEAGNNLTNLLQKFSSREFSDSIAKVIKPQRGDAVTKDGDFDWAGYLIQQRGQGKNAIEAFNAILDRQLGGDKRYQELQSKIGAAGSDQERRGLIESMATVAEGNTLGQVLADRQALLGAMAMRYGSEDLTRIKGGVADSAGTVAGSSEFVREQAFARAQDVKTQADIANQNAFNAIAGPFGEAAKFASDLASEFPNVTAAAYAAGTAITAMTAAAAGFAAFSMLTKGGAAAAGAGAAGAAGSAIAGGAAVAAGVAKGALVRAIPVALVATGAGVIADAVLPETNADEGRAAFDKGEYLKASYKMPAADFLSAIWNGGTGSPSASAAAQQPAPTPLPEPDEGRAAFDKGEYFKASYKMPAGDFLGAIWDKIAGDDKESEAAQAAAAASEAASQAATAAQNRPNVTNHNQYSFTITAPTDSPDALGAKLKSYIEQVDRQREADARASYVGNPAW